MKIYTQAILYSIAHLCVKVIERFLNALKLEILHRKSEMHLTKCSIHKVSKVLCVLNKKK